MIEMPYKFFCLLFVLLYIIEYAGNWTSSHMFLFLFLPNSVIKKVHDDKNLFEVLYVEKECKSWKNTSVR